MTNSNPVTLQEVENNIEIATKALTDAAITAKEIRKEMEVQVSKTIKTIYTMFGDDPKRAQQAVFEMGYTKEDIRACGYDVV